MSVLGEHPEAIINEKDLQIWNNAAFDNGADSESLNSNNLIKPPAWFVKKPVSVNRSSDSFDSISSSFSSKENQIPIGLSKTSGFVLHPLQQSKPLKYLPIGQSKSGVLENSEEKTDEEIEIENEINRLFARLEAIRLEKQGKTVAAKFKEPLKNNDAGVRKIEQSGFPAKVKRRGFSLGPNEIMSATNPKSKQPGTTPIQSIQNRRKSCFWKLGDIEEEKAGFSRGKTRQAVTSIGSKKPTKKDDLILGSIHPKKLFGEQSVPAKKPLKPGRVIPSRYNQATVTSALRKKSAMDNILIGKSRGTEGRAKRKWEIPGEIVIPKKLDLDDDYSENGSRDSVVPDVVQEILPELLPRIRAVRCVDEPGRDSGPAKRVAELVGKKSYFAAESVDEERVCQILSFEED